MENKNSDNSFELYSRRLSTQNVPPSNDARADATTNPNSNLSGSGVDASATNANRQSSIDEYNPTSIAIISGNDGGGRRSSATRPPSIKLKPNRKRSSTGSDSLDKNDSNNKTSRMKGRSTLTSSFLRRKRVEYAGTNAN